MPRFALRTLGREGTLHQDCLRSFMKKNAPVRHQPSRQHPPSHRGFLPRGIQLEARSAYGQA